MLAATNSLGETLLGGSQGRPSSRWERASVGARKFPAASVPGGVKSQDFERSVRMKRLIVFCDGTWNKPDKTEAGIPIATNVVRLAEAVPRNDPGGTRQCVYYGIGVGTEGTWRDRLRGGATGRGLSNNIAEAYRFLIQEFEPGDELFFFGFSRGAFTVRSLAGLVRKCGILLPKYAPLTERAFELYRARGNASRPRGREATLFRRTYAWSESTPIKFVGVWDTVGSLGNPLLRSRLFTRRDRFHDLDLSSSVQHAFQALAIDEKRRHFRAALWNQQDDAPTDQVLEQMWFIGVHSNVGGGYPRRGLSDISLGWMVEKARAAGLCVGEIEMEPLANEDLDESRRGLYRLIPAWRRPIGRSGGDLRTNESLHPTVLERYRLDREYRPKNLLAYLARAGAADL